MRVAHSEVFGRLSDDGWETENKRIEDGFLYVTVKRAVEAAEAPETKVAKALAKFFALSFDRSERLHM